MTDREKYLTLQLKYWYSMFPDGYIGDGVYVDDMLEDDFDEMDEQERNDSIGYYTTCLKDATRKAKVIKKRAKRASASYRRVNNA
jgi:hypothetical protein